MPACSLSLPCNVLQTVAEQAAWEIAKKEDLDLCVINPTFVLGPVISERTDATSIKNVKVGYTCVAQWPQAPWMSCLVQQQCHTLCCFVPCTWPQMAILFCHMG